MKTIPLIWQSYRPGLTPCRGYWDYEIVEMLVANRYWRPACAYAFTHIEMPDPFPESDTDGAIIVLPARHHATAEYARHLAGSMLRRAWAIVMLIGDEESIFPTEFIVWAAEQSGRIWTMMAPPDDKYTHRRLLNGATPHIHLLDNTPCPEKSLDWFFSGQVTHVRREQCVQHLRLLSNGCLIESKGFTEGVAPAEYVHLLSQSKFAPAPSGPRAPDSFRFAEALELGCVPIADALAPVPYPAGYWASVMGENLPFPVIENWADLPQVIESGLASWPANANRCSAFYMQHKRELTYQLQRDITDLSGQSPEPAYLDDQATAIIFTSPSPWHPSTEHIDRVVASIRFHFPLMEILILCDGVRDELSHRKVQYEEYLRQLCWKCQRHRAYWNVLPIIFDKHLHQASMLRETLADPRYVKTPLLFMFEHDTPVVKTGEYISYNGITVNTTRPIPWQAIFEMTLSEEANVVRLYHRGDGIPEPHAYLMKEKFDSHGETFLRTMAWSQRPHIARVDYYKRMLSQYVSPDANCMIEDALATRVMYQPWENNRVVIYWPSDEEAMRSWHSDSRCGPDGEWDSKFEELFKY